MAQSSSSLQLLVLFFILMLVNTPQGGAITCNDVNNNLAPCLSYVFSGGNVNSSCCSGVKTLLSLAKTRNDRQTACSCLKSLAVRATDVQLKRAQSIPKSCAVTIPFAISRNVDCSKVQ